MSSIVKASVIAAFLTGFAPLAISGDDKQQDEVEQKAIAGFEKLKKYESTGEVKRCILLNRIRSTSVLDGQTIFFRMLGRKHYVNRMKRNCPSLAREQRFMYKTSIGQLCSIDIITVLDSFGRSWASCGLGKFEEIKLKPDPEKEKPEDKAKP